MIRAILRAQFLSMRLFRPGSASRSAVFSLLVALLWYGFWSFLAFAAYELAATPAWPGQMERYLSVALLLVLAYWQLAPMMSAGMGASLDFRKLLVYPIPHRSLFAIEVLLRLTTGVEMLLVLAGGVSGLIRNPLFGRWAAAPRLLAAALVFVGFNLLLAAGLRNVLERLLARKRLREILILVLVVTLAAPRLLMASGVRWSYFERWMPALESWIWPWAAVSRAMLGQGAAPAWLVLAGWTAAAWVFGRWQFERNLRFDAQAAQATEERETPHGESWMERFYRLPGLFLPDPLAALVEKELRTLSRTPRFRTVFIMGFTFGLVVWLPMVVGRGDGPPSAFAENFLAVVSIYALAMLGQVSYWNSFGFDRSAAQVYFSLPVPVSQALAGKNLAAGLFILLEVAAVTAACLLLRVRLPAERILEAYVVAPVCALYMLGLGNLSSVHFPRAMSPERVSQGGSSHRFQGLLFVFYPITLLPVFLAYLARYAFGTRLAFWLVLGFAAAIGAAFYWIAMESAVSAANSRREALLAELSRGEGPLITE